MKYFRMKALTLIAIDIVCMIVFIIANVLNIRELALVAGCCIAVVGCIMSILVVHRPNEK